jgi:cellulose synthase/poly-beta-1,6-N-acetylglucosamine synthase-like glycosyltransferase
MIFLFWLCAGALLLAYLGYPLLLLAVGAARRRAVRKAEFFPSVSILISAYNEEACLAATLENKLALRYPADKREIIVVSDGSTDRTAEIARAFAPRGVRLLVQETRGGKTAALNRAAAEAAGEILVFSDANSLYHPDALARLAANFHDPDVGYVTGKMVYADDKNTWVGAGCGAYMRYENLLRSLETRVGSVVGVDGGVDAVRKSLYEPMRPDLLPDLVLPLAVIARGRRVVYEEEALLTEPALSEGGDEWSMRIRVILRSFHALWHMRRLFNPRASGFYALQLFIHKVLRYLAGFFQAGALASNVFLVDRGGVYVAAYGAQLLFYGGAAAGAVLNRLDLKLRPLNDLSYFCLLNGAAAAAFWKFLKGEKRSLWVPRKG